MLTTNHSNTGDMNVPTFYVSETGTERDEMGLLFVIPVVGVVFGGIHCVGWFLNFPSSAVLTSTAFPLYSFLLWVTWNFLTAAAIDGFFLLLFFQSSY